MLTLLTAFALHVFGAGWPWWTAFVVILIADVLIAIARS